MTMFKNLFNKNDYTNWDDWEIDEIENNKTNRETKILFGIILYIIFLLIGILGTTYFEGKPQILSFEIIQKRKAYNALISYVEKTKYIPSVTATELNNNISQNDIIDKLTALNTQNDILQSQLNDLQKNKYKFIKYNEELYNIIFSYLMNKKQLVERMINYYRSHKEYGKNTIIKQYNAFKVYEKKIFKEIKKIKEYDLFYERRDIVDDIIQQP